MTIREDLIAARALIDTPEKWGKGSLQIASDCYCALGAVHKSVNGNIEADWSDRADKVDKVLIDQLPSDFAFHDIVMFNDAPTTTHADIMALFDRAIAAQKE